MFGGHDGSRTRINTITAVFSRTAEKDHWKRAPVVDPDEEPAPASATMPIHPLTYCIWFYPDRLHIHRFRRRRSLYDSMPNTLNWQAGSLLAQRLTLHTHHLPQCIHHLNQLPLRMHHGINVFIGRWNFINYIRIFTTFHAFGLGNLIFNGIAFFGLGTAHHPTCTMRA